MNARTPRQELLVQMAAAAAVGNLDPFADEILKLRADIGGVSTLRLQLVAAMEGEQDMRATAEAALGERNLAVAALQYLRQQFAQSDLPASNGAILNADAVLAQMAAGGTQPQGAAS
jgi:hypothetical protein